MLPHTLPILASESTASLNQDLDKVEMRRHFRELLRGNDSSRSDKISIINLKLGEFLRQKKCRTLIGYCAISHEVSIAPVMSEFIQSRAGRLFLPRFNEGNGCYDLAEVFSLEKDLVTGRYGILEPGAQCPVPDKLEEPAVWLVPGLAFTASGIRLGRGGGYYDRLLAHFDCGTAVGVAWQCQMTDLIPEDRHDIRMACVITEN